MVELLATIKFQHRSVLEVLKDDHQFGVYVKYDNEIIFDHWRSYPGLMGVTYIAQAIKPHLMINCMSEISISPQADLKDTLLIAHLIDALKE